MTDGGPPPAPDPAANHPSWLPLLLLLCLGTLWGGTFSIAKIAMVLDFPPLAYAFWQTSGAGLVLLALYLLRGNRIRISRPHIRFFFVAALIGLALPNTNAMIALRHVPASLMAILVTAVPLLTLGLALGLRIERPDPWRGTGLGLGFAGALLIVLPEGSLPDQVATGWVLLAFLTPLCYAVGNILIARLRPQGSGNLALTTGMLLTAGGLLLLPTVLTGQFRLPVPGSGAEGWAAGAVLLQILISAVAYQIYFAIIGMAGPVFVAQVGYVITATGILFGYLLFSETHSAWVALAVGLIFAGVAIVNWRQNRRR